MRRFLQYPSSFVLLFLSFVILFLPGTAHMDEIAVYWGEGGIEMNLSETCRTGYYSIVSMAYLNWTIISRDDFSAEYLSISYFSNSFSTFCSETTCPSMSIDIKNCQKLGIKVMLSLDPSITDVLSSSEDAKNVSDYLWKNFLGGGSRNSSSLRPLGDAILDGIDFPTPNFFTDQLGVELARYLKSHTTKSQNVYLSLAADCTFPDYDALGKAFQTGVFDYVWIKYYDNQFSSCLYDEGNVSGILTSWNYWTTTLKTGKLFLAAFPVPKRYIGYIPVYVFTSQVLDVIRRSSKYGGVMLGSSTDEGNEYSRAILNYNKTISKSHPCPQKIIEFGCRGHRNGFVERFGYMATHGFVVSTKNGSIDRQCCEVICRNNCSCDAYALFDFDNNSTGCQLWSKGTRFIKSSVGNLQPVYFVKKKVSNWWIWLIIAVGAAVAILVLSYLYCVLSTKYKRAVDRKRKRKKLLAEVGGTRMGNYGKTKKTTEDKNTTDEIHVFSLEILIVATNNFSLDNKLGEGGFGPVYKGELIDGQEIAIKRLSKSSGQGLLEFKNEAKIMVKIQHTNLVRLLGFCMDKDERILIYEYMPNKSLDFYLFDVSRKIVLDWKKRLDIIEGIAQGLVYLHRYSRIKVIHRDLKPSNILLDEGMNPKIADFGMARIFGLKGQQENTNRVVGTYGYMPPEYAINGVVSIKTDVYSYGVMLLEIISGMKNNSLIHSNEPFNLTGHAWHLWNENRAIELIDSSLKESQISVEVQRCIQIGLLCIQDHAAERPTIQDVVSYLSNYAIQLGQPKKPAFFVSRVEEDFGLPGSRQETYSLNGVSISTVYGR